MASTPKKIVITNIVTLNPGDGAILEGMVHLLKVKYGQDARITIFDNKAASAKQYYPFYDFKQSMFYGISNTTFLAKTLKRFGYGHWNIRLRYWATLIILRLLRLNLGFIAKPLFGRQLVESVSTYHDADAILSTGGTYLIENYDLTPAIHDYRLSMATGNPLVFFTQTLGPFTKPRIVEAFQSIFQYASNILVRDDKSLQHLLQIGVNEKKVTLVKDAAFVLPAITQRQPHEVMKVAISVRELKFFEDANNTRASAYKESIQAAVTYLVRELQADVTFLSTCQGIKEYWTDDSAFANSLMADLPEDVLKAVTVDTQFRLPKDVMTSYSRFDLVIATRMHAAILAVNSAVPTIGIAYEFKIEELYKQLKLEPLLVSISSICPEKLIQAIQSFRDDPEKWNQYFYKLSESTTADAEKVVEVLPTL